MRPKVSIRLEGDSQMELEYRKVRSIEPWEIYAPWKIREHTRKTRKTTVRCLSLGQTAGDRELAETLAACHSSETERCGRPMCPICVERLRHSFVLEAVACIGALMQRRKFPISWLCADLPGERYQLGDLRSIDFTSLNQRVRSQYIHAGFPLVFSGIHLTVVENRHANAKPFWQTRLYSVIVGLAKKHLPEALGNLYPEHSWNREFDLDLATALYSIIVPTSDREVTDTQGGWEEPCYKNLRAQQLAELAHCFARYDMGVRYNLVGCRWDNGRIHLNPEVPERLHNSYPPDSLLRAHPVGETDHVIACSGNRTARRMRSA
jgi:hypothetical protein